MANLEKIWTSEAKMQYPKQWIVMVNLEDDCQTNKVMGYVHVVTPSQKEAYKKAKELEDIMGRTVVIEGFDDTPQIGGLTLWRE
ncbi:MAG: hypothetical protein FWC89_06890 [Defluviitaleaceae bacterium]|nr:hypothetical protein [Defluviitaleaceae bacterium]